MYHTVSVGVCSEQVSTAVSSKYLNITFHVVRDSDSEVDELLVIVFCDWAWTWVRIWLMFS